MQIQSAVAFITGANRGIGRAFVDELLARGAKRVYASTRDAASLETLARLDPRVRPIRLDVRNADDAAAAARLAADTSLLINNAGTLSLGSPSTVPVNADRSQGGRAAVRGHVSPVHCARSNASSQRLLKRSVKRRPSRHVTRVVAVTACRVAR